jgi:hypothetical protein
MSLRVELAGENQPKVCDCCGNETKTVWGYVYWHDVARAAYFVQWTRNKKEHYPHFDFLVGTWGDDTIRDKKLISFVYNATHETGGSFMVIDSADRPAARSDLCSVALKRGEVVNDHDLMGVATEMIDAVWLSDPRIEEIRNFAKNA